jgi:hypothetical protein
MSSTELSAVDQSEVAMLLGALQGNTSEDTIKVPFLKVQYEPEDKQGRDVKRGTFLLSDSENPVYATTAKIRVLAQHFQYRESDPQTYKIVNKTVLMDDMRKREPRDMKGGMRCGRPDAKTLRQLSDEDQQMWRKRVQAFRILRGIVTMEGKNADGETVKVENQPFQMFLKGINFIPFEDSVIKALPHGKGMTDIWVDLSTTKKGKAFIIDFAADYNTPAVMDTDTVDTLRVFYDMAKQENQRIETGYKNAHLESEAFGSASDAINGYAEDLEADLN